ncbi:MAG: DUF4357 domain-containing protein [Rhodobacteraceae bacterium]|nr:DUF4357 domain-containing protein [Paracoccaceae bacterium]
MAAMAAFMENIELVLPMIGADFLRPAPQRIAAPEQGALPAIDTGPHTPNAPVAGVGNTNAPVFHAVYPKSGISARMIQVGDGQFIIRSGSIGSCREAPTLPQIIKRRRREAFDRNLAERRDDGTFILNQDIEFNNPGAASRFISGSNNNGRTYWKTEDEQTYGEWQQAGIDQPHSQNPEHPPGQDETATPPNLAHTKMIAAEVNGQQIAQPSWNKILVGVIAAVQSAGLRGEHLVREPGNWARAGIYEGKGYRFYPGLGISIKGLAAPVAWKKNRPARRCTPNPRAGQVCLARQTRCAASGHNRYPHRRPG